MLNKELKITKKFVMHDEEGSDVYDVFASGTSIGILHVFSDGRQEMYIEVDANEIGEELRAIITPHFPKAYINVFGTDYT